MSVTLTRTSATELRVLTPVQHAPVGTTVVEYRLTKNGTGTWSVKGCYGRDLTLATVDVQLSDTTDSSVWEYALQVGVSTAPQGSYDYVGLVHSNELATAVTQRLDGVDVASLGIGASATGTALVLDQTISMLLPKNSDGTPNGVTVCGASTLRHTFTDAGLLVEHTHTIASGYQALNWYVANQPASVANLNRIQIDQIRVQTPVTDGLFLLGYGIRATAFTAWHASAHSYRLALRLPSGGPSVPADWSHAAPAYGYFLDDSSRKFRLVYVGDVFANRQPSPATGLGPIAHATLYTVEWGAPAALPTPRANGIGAGTTASSGGGTTRWA